MKNNKKPPSPVRNGVARVPMVIQLEALECGAACLNMILAYYGKWIPLEQVRADCGVSRDGSNARNILLAARAYGLSAQGYRFEPGKLREEGTFPCIIHWNFNHFVVLCGFRGNKAVLNDPAKGTYTVSMESFDQSFTGVCILFEPSAEFEPGGRPKSVLAFARKRLSGTGSAFAFVITTSVIASLIGLMNPVFSRVFLDRLLTGQNPDWLYPFLGALFVFAAVQLTVQWIQAIYLLKINGKFAIIGNSSFIWHVLHMPMEFFSQRMAGDIASRQNTNGEIANTLVSTFAPLALNGIMLVFYLVIMFRYSARLSFLGIASVLVNLIFSRIISKMRINITRVQMRDAGKLTGATVSGIEMIESIKASGAENGYFEKWTGYQASVNAQQVRLDRLDQYLGAIPALVSSLLNIAVLISGAALTMQGEFTVGMIMAFQGFLVSFMAPAQKLIDSGQLLLEMRTNMERIEDVMEYPSEDIFACESGEETFKKLTGEVELKNVTFGYSPLDKPLIEHFSLKIRQGGKVALVGNSGCGKSTVAKLISGLYQPWSGEILFDGRPLKEISRPVFKGSLAVVDQDIILFEDTIAANIKMWDSSIEDYEMIMAAKDAQLHEDIMQRDGGYQYQMLDGGKDFSGGQRQRLEIARVLAQDPTIIIMDEATSALDAETEREVVNAIQKRGVTCIVIAHRLSTIRDCDEILVMDRGRVVERGTHEELYRQGGLYTELVRSE